MSHIYPGRAIPLRAQLVIQDVAGAHGVTPVELLGPAVGARKVQLARRSAYARLRALGHPYSYPFIANIFRRHYTTVLHGVQLEQSHEHA